MKRQSPWCHWSHFKLDQSVLRRLRRRRRSDPLQHKESQVPHHRMKRRSPWRHHSHFMPDQSLLRRWLRRRRRSHPFKQMKSQIPHHRMKRQSPWCHWSHFKLDQSVLRRLRRRRRSDPLQHKESQVPHHRMQAAKSVATLVAFQAGSELAPQVVALQTAEPPVQANEKPIPTPQDEAAKSVAPPLAFQPPLAFHAGSELAPQDEAAKSVAPPLAFQAGSELAPQATPTGILDRENEVKDRMKRLLECSCESGKLTEVLQDMVNERRAQSESKAEHIENAVVADDLRERMRGLLENACEDGALAQALSGISCFEAEATGTATDSMQKTSTCQPTTSSEPLARATADCAEQFPAVPETTLEAPTAQLPTTPQPPKEAAPGSQRPSMEIKKLYEQIASMRQDNASLHLQVGALAVQMEDLKKDNQNLVSRITNRLPPSPA
eukprot:TRINITY_DN13189_c0_g1_i6.p1 TRINITY_DN13189_c0_g1~~TRINITY_DN13189_c0_g1_i6.p1  ORF type:complete len:438 (-),score=67.71 TRINITY_DN13189_c0_g1_i6:71-1384(-)